MRSLLILLACLTAGEALAQRIVGPPSIERKGNKRIIRPGGLAPQRTGAPRPTTQLQREVDTLIMNLGSRNDTIRKRTQDRIKTLNEKAVPRLVEHITAHDANMKMLSIAALQYCWSDDAEMVITNVYLNDADTPAKVAYAVLAKRVATGKMPQSKLDKLRAKKK